MSDTQTRKERAVNTFFNNNDSSDSLETLDYCRGYRDGYVSTESDFKRLLAQRNEALEMLLWLALQSGELVAATDGQEGIRHLRKGTLKAIKGAEAVLSKHERKKPCVMN